MRRTTVWLLALVTLLTTAAAAAQETEQETAQAQAEASARAERGAGEEAYARAAEALDRAEYARAVELYREIAEQRGARADAASYWMAYAMAKQGSARAALRALERLRNVYPRSEWLDDAGYLEAELREQTGSGLTPEQAGEQEMRMYALNALIRRDPERALPALQSILDSDDSSREMKRRALFVLLQSGSEQGLDMAAEVARSSDDRELRLDALRHLGMMGGARGAGLLQEIYDSTDDRETRITVIEGWAMNGQTDRLREIARTSSDEELRVAAIRSLAFAGDAEGLWDLYDTSQSREIRAAILEHIVMTGDSDRLLQVLRTEQDPELRVAAIRGVAMMGRRGDVDESEAREAELREELRRVYDTGDRETRSAVIEAMAMREDVPALIELFDQETDPELRTQIVRMLSMSDSDEALDFLVRILEQGF
jgi:hypothetical protein